MSKTFTDDMLTPHEPADRLYRLHDLLHKKAQLDAARADLEGI